MIARPFCLLLATLAVSFPWTRGAHAQSTQDELRTRLLNHTFFLHGGWIEDKLKFGAAGQPEKQYKTGPPSVCGFRADEVQLSGDRVRITGVRIGFTYPDHVETPVALPESGKRNAPDEKVTIEIDGHGKTDFTDAVRQIFVQWEAAVEKVNLPSPGKLLPACKESSAVASAQGNVPAIPVPCAPAFERGGGPLKPPKLLSSAEPDFSEWARRLKYSGNVNVYVVVDAQGLPARVKVARPAGLGLDEQAVAAVNKYRFEPAMQNGHAVPTELTVEVNFQIF